jgi:hypothetical protein
VVRAIYPWRGDGQGVDSIVYVNSHPVGRSLVFVKGKKIFVGRVNTTVESGIFPIEPSSLLRIGNAKQRKNRFDWDGFVTLSGTPIGTFELSGWDRFADGISIATPIASYANTLRVDTVVRTLEQSMLLGSTARTEVTRLTSYFASGIGLVKSIERSILRRNGRVLESRDPIETWFTGGRIGGLPVAATPPSE